MVYLFLEWCAYFENYGVPVLRQGMSIVRHDVLGAMVFLRYAFIVVILWLYL